MNFKINDRVILSVPDRCDDEYSSFHYAPGVIGCFHGKEVECTVVVPDRAGNFGTDINGDPVHVVGVESVALEIRRAGHDLGGILPPSRGYSGQWVLPRHLRPADEGCIDAAFIEENLSSILLGGTT